MALAAAKRARGDDPAACRWWRSPTAHPAKFPDAVESATGVRPEAPPRLAEMMRLPERLDKFCPTSSAAVEDFVAIARAARGRRKR